MHTIKIAPNLLFEYQCTSGKFIRLTNRIESKLFLPELECSSADTTSATKPEIRNISCQGITPPEEDRDMAGNMHKTFREARTCSSEDMIADRQTHTQTDTLITILGSTIWGGVIIG